jgi:hypothetical protein
MIKSGEVKYPESDWKKVNKDARSFVEFLLQHNINSRPTAAEAL